MKNYLGPTLLDLYGMRPLKKARSKFTLDEAKAVGASVGIDWDSSPFDAEQFLMGLNVELEHGLKHPDTNVTNDDEIATGKIALVHLNEKANYYDKLKLVEKAFLRALDAEFDKYLNKSLSQRILVPHDFVDKFGGFLGIEKSARGEAKPGHRYIRREGVPGNYTYIYEETDDTIGGEEAIPQKLKKLLLEYKEAKDNGEEGVAEKLKQKIKNNAGILKLDLKDKDRKKAMWEMTKEEFVSFATKLDDELSDARGLMTMHEEIVYDAIVFQGVAVPDKVREEYPQFKDLKKKG